MLGFMLGKMLGMLEGRAALFATVLVGRHGTPPVQRPEALTGYSRRAFPCVCRANSKAAQAHCVHGSVGVVQA
jgi:hypothetical protein